MATDNVKTNKQGDTKPVDGIDVAPDAKGPVKAPTTATVAAAAAPMVTGPSTGMPAGDAAKAPPAPAPLTKAPTEAQAAVKTAEQETQIAAASAQQQAKDAELTQEAKTEALASDLAAGPAPGATQITGSTLIDRVSGDDINTAHPSDMPTEEAKAEAAEKEAQGVESVTVGAHEFIGQKAKLWTMLKSGAAVHEMVEELKWEAHQVIATLESMVQMTGAKLEAVGVGAARKFTVQEPEKIDTAGM